MDMLGINWASLIVQLLFLGSWPVLSLIALFALRRRALSGVTQALWACLIVVVPILGAAAFFIVRPFEERKP